MQSSEMIIPQDKLLLNDERGEVESLDRHKHHVFSFCNSEIGSKWDNRNINEKNLKKKLSFMFKNAEVSFGPLIEIWSMKDSLQADQTVTDL